MRSLAHIEKVEWKHPIEGRDRIELIGVLGWSVIAKKDEFQVGDKVVYIEIDSILPEREEFEFLRDKNFRIKTMKIAGVVSQGIVFPLSILGNQIDPLACEIGGDVTNILKIKKYEPESAEPVALSSEPQMTPLIKKLMKHKCLRWIGRLLKNRMAKKNARLKKWPDFISKTDEPRVQNMPWVLDQKIPFIATEKVDGQSGTFFLVKKPGLFHLFHRYEFGVCSRNYRLPKPDNSSYWTVAQKYHLEFVLNQLIKERYHDVDFIAIQGEIIGPGIQQNKYKRTEYELYAFNLVVPYGKIDSVRARAYLSGLGVPFVPILDTEYRLPDTVDEMLAQATGESKLAPTLREGLVLRNYLKQISFKAVSNDFLLKWKE